MRKSLSYLNFIALIVTVLINYLSNTRFFNDTNMAEVSARYQNYFTPAGYAFSIWGLIYLLLAIFTIGQIVELRRSWSERIVTGQIGPWFVVSCLANCLWVINWLHDNTGFTVVIMILLLVSLLIIIQRIYKQVTRTTSLKTRFLTLTPFAIYAGWISVALIANIAAYLTKVDLSLGALSSVNWAIVMMIVAVFVNLYMVWYRNLPEFSLVGVWALVAIGIANHSKVGLLANAAFMLAGLLLVNFVVYMVVRNRTSQTVQINQD